MQSILYIVYWILVSIHNACTYYVCMHHARLKDLICVIEFTFLNSDFQSRPSVPIIAFGATSVSDVLFNRRGLNRPVHKNLILEF